LTVGNSIQKKGRLAGGKTHGRKRTKNLPGRVPQKKTPASVAAPTRGGGGGSNPTPWTNKEEGERQKRKPTGRAPN